MNKISRRYFLKQTAAMGGTTLLGAALGTSQTAQGTMPPTAAPRIALEPFPMTQVRLLDGREKVQQESNRRYLHALDSASLLYNFRKNAGLPTPGKPLGGWEAPDCEVRGHFTGHYLSACALMYSSTGDAGLKTKADQMVAEMAKCQEALNEGGYLSAFPTSFIDRVEAQKPVWAPYYTIHKILAGLVDMYQHCGNTQALQVAKHMADYFHGRCNKLTDAQMAGVMRNEFGGMANVLYDLYAITGQPQYRDLAHRFDQKSFLGPLSLEHDDLTGIHANTHIPKILGAGRRYELLDDAAYGRIVPYFWDRVVNHRTYATGGDSAGEYWGEPDKLAHTLVPNNQETCVTYNMLKVTRDLIRWTGDPKYADFYGRAYYNGILSAQNPHDGMLIYYTPLAANETKNWGSPHDSFWCCYGTGVESFAKLNDSIYFHNQDGLFVNLYVPSEVHWPEKGIRLVQRTRFPEEQTASFVVHTQRPTKMTLNLHIPFWAQGSKVMVNGKPLPVTPTPTSYLPIARTWKNGDEVQIYLPMHLHTQSMPDDLEMQAIMVGPLVLAGLIDDLVPTMQKAGLLPAHGEHITSWLKPVSGQPLTFRTAGLPDGALGLKEDITFRPLYQIVDQSFAAYWVMAPRGSERYQTAVDARAKQSAAEAAFAARLVDQVQPHNHASELAHNLVEQDSGDGTFQGSGYRDGSGAFQWTLKVLADVPMTLQCTYWGSDIERTFDILVNGQKIATQTLDGSHPNQFFDVEYPLERSLTANQTNTITVRFVAHPGSLAGGVFRCATLKQEKSQ